MRTRTVWLLGIIALGIGILLWVGWEEPTAPIGPNPESDTTQAYRVYSNDRFGYTVEIPESFTVTETAQNNDGQTFADPASSSSVRVFGRHNINNQSLQELLSAEVQQLQAVRDAEVGSSTATVFGRDQMGPKAVALLHSSSTLAFVQITGPTAAATTTRQHITDSLRWVSGGDQSPDDGTAVHSDQRPISYTPDAARDLMEIVVPTRAATITSPLEITGQARGQWFFEADAPVVLTDWDGRIIAEGFITAEGDWITEDFVPFSGTLTFDVPPDTGPQSVRGSLIIQRANPSGQLSNDMAVEIPVRFER